MNVEDREKYLKTKQTFVFENIAPNELELMRHIIQEEYNPARDDLPMVFDFLQKSKGGDDEIVCSYVMLETKTRKTIKPVKGNARLKYLKDAKEEKTPDKKKSNRGRPTNAKVQKKSRAG